MFEVLYNFVEICTPNVEVVIITESFAVEFIIYLDLLTSSQV